MPSEEQRPGLPNRFCLELRHVLAELQHILMKWLGPAQNRFLGNSKDQVMNMLGSISSRSPMYRRSSENRPYLEMQAVRQANSLLCLVRRTLNHRLSLLLPVNRRYMKRPLVEELLVITFPMLGHHRVVLHRTTYFPRSTRPVIDTFHTGLWL